MLPRLTVLSVLTAASSPCPDLKLIHYKFGGVAGRALRYLPRIVAWALPMKSMAWFPSRAINSIVFFVGEAHATAGCG